MLASVYVMRAVFLIISDSLLEWVVSAVLLISLTAVVVRGKKRVLMAAGGTLSWAILGIGSIVGVARVLDFLSCLRASNKYEKAAFLHLVFGTFALSYWWYFLACLIAPQLFWLRRCRTNAWLALIICASIIGPSYFGRMASILAQLPK